MMLKPKFRLSLRWLFILISIATCIAGLYTWQRLRTLHAYDALRKKGIAVTMTGEGFWFVQPVSGDIHVMELSDREWEIASKSYTWPEAEKQLRKLKGEIERLGIPRVKIRSYIFGPRYSQTNLTQFALDELGPWNPSASTRSIDETLDWVEFKSWWKATESRKW